MWSALETDYDIVVLDAMIPPPDGFEVCRRMRGQGRWMPVLILTARDAVADRVDGLVDVYVRYLRDKIDRPFGRDTVQTVRGAGYRIQPGA
jgi:DNA-binding response OmpR family regulator